MAEGILKKKKIKKIKKKIVAKRKRENERSKSRKTICPNNEFAKNLHRIPPRKRKSPMTWGQCIGSLRDNKKETPKEVRRKRTSNFPRENGMEKEIPTFEVLGGLRAYCGRKEKKKIN